MEAKYSQRCPAVKRLMREAKELHQTTEHYYAQPLDDNLFEWHFTVRGPADTDFEGGLYHGRIILPADYPMKPPSIILLTPNGRFETGTKICLSISGHHPESWQPSWSIRTAMLAIIGFMPTKGAGAIGSLDYTPNERKVLSKKSQEWKCNECGALVDHLLPAGSSSQSEQDSTTKEAAEIAQQISFKKEEPKTSSSGDDTPVQSPPTTATADVPTESPGVPTDQQQTDQFAAFMQATQLNSLSFQAPTFANNNEYQKFYESYIRSYQQLANLSMGGGGAAPNPGVPSMFAPTPNMTPNYNMTPNLGPTPPNLHPPTPGLTPPYIPAPNPDLTPPNLHRRNPGAGSPDPAPRPPAATPPIPIPERLRLPEENPRNDKLMFLIAVAVAFLMLALIYRRFSTHYYRFAF